jgi:hypothetical protein
VAGLAKTRLPPSVNPSDYSGRAGPAVIMLAVGAGLIGFGVGASVSPALFITGFSLRSAQIQRIFALVELLRGVTAFLAAPILRMWPPR